MMLNKVQWVMSENPFVIVGMPAIIEATLRPVAHLFPTFTNIFQLVNTKTYASLFSTINVEKSSAAEGLADGQ